MRHQILCRRYHDAARTGTRDAFDDGRAALKFGQVDEPTERPPPHRVYYGVGHPDRLVYGERALVEAVAARQVPLDDDPVSRAPELQKSVRADGMPFLQVVMNRTEPAVAAGTHGQTLHNVREQPASLGMAERHRGADAIHEDGSGSLHGALTPLGMSCSRRQGGCQHIALTWRIDGVRDVHLDIVFVGDQDVGLSSRCHPTMVRRMDTALAIALGCGGAASNGSSVMRVLPDATTRSPGGRVVGDGEGRDDVDRDVSAGERLHPHGGVVEVVDAERLDDGVDHAT